MGRAKIICRGKTNGLQPCSNWALKGNYYCHLHQNQTTKKDQSDMQNTETIGRFIMIAFLFIAFLISLAAGCEDSFLKWMTR